MTLIMRRIVEQLEPEFIVTWRDVGYLGDYPLDLCDDYFVEALK